MNDVIIIGAGAGGFFTAINLAEKFPQKKILMLEKAKQGLQKVRISGGGRCNVTNAEPDFFSFAKNYPRGEKELLGVLHRFSNADVMRWFSERGVPLVSQADGRIFPASNTSASVVNCFESLAQRLGVQILYQKGVTNLKKTAQGWEVFAKEDVFQAKNIVIATGSSAKMWAILQDLGHRIVSPVPSLFSLCTAEKEITQLAGISVVAGVSLLTEERQKIKIEKGEALPKITAPLLISHTGFTGPAVLRLSAWAARVLHRMHYRSILRICWAISDDKPLTQAQVFEVLKDFKTHNFSKLMGNASVFALPKRLWQFLLERAGASTSLPWGNASEKLLQKIAQELTQSDFHINGKATFKQEFVTAGGVCRKEVDFRRFASKILPSVYFTGEVIDIDAVTGGFNFQNAWSGGYIIVQEMF